jgi:hypothetical protein
MFYVFKIITKFCAVYKEQNFIFGPYVTGNALVNSYSAFCMNAHEFMHWRGMGGGRGGRTISWS